MKQLYLQSQVVETIGKDNDHVLLPQTGPYIIIQTSWMYFSSFSEMTWTVFDISLGKVQDRSIHVFKNYTQH